MSRFEISVSYKLSGLVFSTGVTIDQSQRAAALAGPRTRFFSNHNPPPELIIAAAAPPDDRPTVRFPEGLIHRNRKPAGALWTNTANIRSHGLVSL